MVCPVNGGLEPESGKFPDEGPKVVRNFLLLFVCG